MAVRNRTTKGKTTRRTKKMTASLAKAGQGVFVVIDVPPAGSDVPGNGTFITQGFVTATPPVNMRAWVNDNGTITMGTQVPPSPHDPAYDWAFSFQGIRTNVYVFLTVEGTDTTGAAGSRTIQIRCVP
jgi:hypothetical protein